MADVTPEKFLFAVRGPEQVGGSRGEVIVEARDLPSAQRVRRRIRSGANGTPPLVLLKIEAVVAETFQQASSLWAHHDPSAAGSSTMRYIGTPAGLAGLIADIAATEVADGVVLVSLPVAGSPALIAQRSIPWLLRQDVIVCATGDLVSRCS